jgi:hypothetical protein
MTKEVASQRALAMTGFVVAVHGDGRKSTIQSYLNHDSNATRLEICHAKAQRRKEKKEESTKY